MLRKACERRRALAAVSVPGTVGGAVVVAEVVVEIDGEAQRPSSIMRDWRRVNLV
jgi:hypothetical protein